MLCAPFSSLARNYEQYAQPNRSSYGNSSNNDDDDEGEKSSNNAPEVFNERREEGCRVVDALHEGQSRQKLQLHHHEEANGGRRAAERRLSGCWRAAYQATSAMPGLEIKAQQCQG